MARCLQDINVTRKDKDPLSTIKVIKEELKKRNIKARIVKILRTKYFYSVRLELCNIPGVGVNGKGISLLYAIASAYSEFMERFLSGFLVKASYFNKDKSSFCFNDESICDYNMFFFEFNKIVNSYLFPNVKEKAFLWNAIKKNENFRKKAPFRNLISGQAIYLPITLINYVAHTNGLCAGNSEEEALVQGICEVLERYCYRTIITKKISVPVIDVGKALHEKLGWLKKRGYTYELRDFSLGIFPVVGLVIYDEKGNYQINVGADPIFEIAVQRCITELFQGLSKGQLKYKFKTRNSCYDEYEEIYGSSFVNANWMKCYTTNNGMVPLTFFSSTETTLVEKLPFIEKKTNSECLQYLTGVCKKENHNIYVREYTKDNFKSYRVYIPGLSEVDLLNDNDFARRILFEDLKEVYFNPWSIKKIVNEYHECATDIRCKVLQKPSNCFNADNYGLSHYFDLGFENLYVLSAYFCGDENFLQRYYGGTSIKNIKNEMSKLIKYLKPPCCPNCYDCFLRKKCKYVEWRKIMEAIYF